MMREILFRGKRMDNGEWVEGYYVRLYGSNGRVSRRIYTSCAEVDCGDYYPDFFEVQPSTVGQYTGLKDMNGKRIFEGDILKIAKSIDHIGERFYDPPLEYPVNVIVKWDLCAWMWETLCKDKFYLSFPNAWCHYECEVIGNAHDNPALLEVR